MPMSTTLTEAEMIRLWELHTQLEFATKDAVATVATMTPENYVNHVPVMTGGRGRDEMIEFYGKYFIPRMPSTISVTEIPAASTVSIRADANRSAVFSFTATPSSEIDKSLAPFVNSTPQPFGLAIY